MPSEKDVFLFDAENIDSLQWPTNEEGSYAKRFLHPLIKNGAHFYIENVQAEVMALKYLDCVIPITVVNEKYGMAHVCSPYDHYVSHVLESLHFIKNKALNLLATGFTHGLGQVLRFAKFNNVVNVNNWLFATDLYPKEFSEDFIEFVSSYLKRRFPAHAIIFRSINPCTNQTIYQSLKKQNSHLIASRQIYLSDTKNDSMFKTRIFKSDLKLLRESHYEIMDGKQLKDEDFPRVVELYKMLYIDKYSHVNPCLSTHFVQFLVRENLLQLKVLKKDNLIEGVVGYFSRNHIMTSPFFGYNQSKSQHSELYRLLSTILMLEAKEKGMILHQGAGASFYKKLRRAESHLEYMAVYSSHLSLRRRMAWQLIKQLMNRLAIPFMKKY